MCTGYVILANIHRCFVAFVHPKSRDINVEFKTEVGGKALVFIQVMEKKSEANFLYFMHFRLGISRKLRICSAFLKLTPFGS